MSVDAQISELHNTVQTSTASSKKTTLDGNVVEKIKTAVDVNNVCARDDSLPNVNKLASKDIHTDKRKKL